MLRTERQNKYYWKCIVLVLGDELGYYKFEMHEILKERFIVETSKELSRKEFNNNCEQIRIWAQQELGIRLMTPNEYN